MSEKRFYISFITASRQIRIVDSETTFVAVVDVYDDKIQYFVDLLNSLNDENEQLRTQLAICQQSKSDDGRFKVWEVPPIPKGMRITTFTTSDGEKDE